MSKYWTSLVCTTAVSQPRGANSWWKTGTMWTSESEDHSERCRVSVLLDSPSLYWYVLTPFSDGSEGKESAHDEGDWSSTPGLGRSPGEGNGIPAPVFLLENSVDRRAWWGCKELDKTERGIALNVDNGTVIPELYGLKLYVIHVCLNTPSSMQKLAHASSLEATVHISFQFHVQWLHIDNLKWTTESGFLDNNNNSVLNLLCNWQTVF